MINKSQKLQLTLTIQFAVFFILLAVFVYYVFTRGFEENVNEKFKSKSEIVVRYIEQNPQIFTDGKLTGKDELSQLLHLNDVIYFVLLDENGLLVDGVNIDEAESNLYLLSEQSKNLSDDGTLYRFHINVLYGDKSNVGKVFLGYKAGTVTFELKKNKLKTILYSLAIMFAGIIFTYFLSLISFRPIFKLYSALETTDRAEQKHLLSKFKGNEVGSLAQKIYDIVVQLDKSSNEVELLNEKLRDVFREKIYELDVEISHRKKAEIFLKKTEEMFKILFENAPIGMLIVSNEGKVIKSNNPDYPFEYKFVDDDFNRLFKTETLIGKLAGIFSMLAIFISCLGLFGLAAYTAERRTKEIGVRKVLGASTQGLAALLSKDFLRLVAISCFIAFPVAWWVMNNWLQSFTYRVNINWTVFAFSGVLALLIAVLTVSFQAIKAAIANPVKSLRTE